MENEGVDKGKSGVEIIIEFQNVSKEEIDCIREKVKREIRRVKIRNRKLEYKYKVNALQQTDHC